MPIKNALHIIFSPLLPKMILILMASAAVALTLWALSRRAPSSLWRSLALFLILLALTNPSLIKEERQPLKDTALLVIDDSASMHLKDRMEQSALAEAALKQKLASFGDIDLETLRVPGVEETDLFRAVEDKLSTLPRNRLAGVLALTDGQIHDQPLAPLPTPFHALLAGHRHEIDRHIHITKAPAFGIVGKSVSISLRVDDEPSDGTDPVPVTLHNDDGSEIALTLPAGKDVLIDLKISHAGTNLFAFSAQALDHELTTQNNSTAVSVNGIRDRLRVLLISGQPHIGERTWRDFLKSDPAVDLVHFTILRSPFSQDPTPQGELALIPFPVHELFDVKLKNFDLIIFDRFRSPSSIPDNYLRNIANYVTQGGALLLTHSTDTGLPALAQSPLAQVLPTLSAGEILTSSFTPALTETGLRHPVTSRLLEDAGQDPWSPWFRQASSHLKHGDVLMTGINDQPLLVLDRVGNGRVAEFLTDQFWLWSRNYKGGGPQGELLRRTVHWLMGEPELDEEALRARVENTQAGWQIDMTKQSLHDTSHPITLVDPFGKERVVTLKEGEQKGTLGATQPVAATGLYRLKDDTHEILVMVGFSNSPEFSDMHATDKKVEAVIGATGGSVHWLEDNKDGPDLRRVNKGMPSSGRGWVGLVRNEQYRITGSKSWPLFSPFFIVILLLGVVLWAWHREGKS